MESGSNRKRRRRRRRRQRKSPVKKIIPWFFVLLCGIGIAWFGNRYWLQSVSHEKNKKEAIRLHQKSVRLLKESRLAEALPTAQKALGILENELGEVHPELAKVLYTLALTHRYQNKFSEAEKEYGRILAIQETAYGKEHPSVGKTLYEMASVFISQRRYVEAERLLNQALPIFEKKYGSDHLSIAQVLSRLAFSYQAGGKMPKATLVLLKVEAMQNRLVHLRGAGVTRKKTVQEGTRPGSGTRDKGPVTVEEAKSLMDRPPKLYRAGKYVEAVHLAKNILEIYEKNMGTGHPLVATGLTNLAFLYENWGTLKVATLYYRRALNIRKKTLGPDHPLVAQSLNNLGMLYRAQGRFKEAGPLFRQSLSILEKKKEPDHTIIVMVLNNLAGLAEKQNEMKKAAALKKRAKVIQSRLTGIKR